MDKITLLLYRELYRKSFYEFVKAFWSEADPSKFVDGILIEYYCEVFQYMCRQWTGDKANKNIVLPEIKEDEELIDIRGTKHNININVPPRHSKSMIFNVLAPIWLWLSYPIKAVSISHTSGLAKDMNKKRQFVINSEKFKTFFSDIKLITNTADSLIDNRGGELYSQNRAAMTGYGGDIIINDDLTNAETARKDKEEMANAWAYFQNTMPSRINDINKCIIMNIQQRLAPNDITGHILSDRKLSDSYIQVCLPAIFKKTTYIVFPISGKVIKFNKGDYLWPERFGNYEALRAQVGETIFETQYLQNAIATDRTVIKEDMIIEKDEIDCPPIENADMIYASHDFPVKDKDSSDFLGSTLAYKVGSILYIKDCLEKRMAFVKSVKYVEDLNEFYPGIIQIIEDKANGSPILQQLQDKVPGLQAYQPGSNSKTQRLESASLYMSSGNIIFVRNNFNKLTQSYELSDSLNNLKQRLLHFPFVEHDDITDSFSQLILYVYMDKAYQVYGRAFNSYNIVNSSEINNISYSTVFFNKEGDNWKTLEIGVIYGEETKIVVLKEEQFKGSVDEGFNKLKEFAPKKSIFIDCSATDGLYGISDKNVSIEKYEIDDFDRSVGQLNLAFSKNRVLLDEKCKLTKNDIETFKFSKSKDENVKYITEKDGFIACLRMALKYYGGII